MCLKHKATKIRTPTKNDIIMIYNTHTSSVLRKDLCVNPLVSGSIIMEFVPICSMETCQLCTLSFTTRNSMSMCFDLDELMLLLKYRTAELLSQYNFSGLFTLFKIYSPMTKFRSHIP